MFLTTEKDCKIFVTNNGIFYLDEKNNSEDYNKNTYSNRNLTKVIEHAKGLTLQKNKFKVGDIVLHILNYDYEICTVSSFEKWKITLVDERKKEVCVKYSNFKNVLKLQSEEITQLKEIKSKIKLLNKKHDLISNNKRKEFKKIQEIIDSHKLKNEEKID